MANASVETVSGGIITITFTDSGANYDSTVHFPGGLKVKSIKFYPSAANDILAIRNGTSTAPIITKMKDTTGGGSVDMSFGEGVWMKPFLLLTDCTFNTPGNVVVMIVIA